MQALAQKALLTLAGVGSLMTPMLSWAEETAAEVAGEAAAEVATLSAGDTAWMLISSALVLLMIIPGLALYYAGMVRSKNALSTMMQVFAIVGVGTLVWFAYGYSLAFGDGGDYNAVIGDLSKALISNWHADVQALVINDATLPVAVGCVKAGQTYLASPQHGFIDYARDECDQLSDASAQRWAKFGLSLVEPWFRALRLDESVSINAWGVSTHLYPSWSENTLMQLRERLVLEHPKRALWIRTLHEGYDASLIEVAQKQGWQLWPSRVVYGFDWKTSSQWMKQRNNQIDQKLLQKTTLTTLFPQDFNASHASTMAQLYQQLYVDKHSRWNAHYTPAYFQHAIEHQWLSFYGFADEQGRLIAFIGVFAQDGVMTTPMLGYDTSLPTELALYRLLMARVLRQSIEQQYYLNLGAGSANFKRMRGGVAHMEWHAFYAHHLPKRQSVAMKITAKLMKRYVPSFLAQQAV